jgi:large subunit ribosomal protein L5e
LLSLPNTNEQSTNKQKLDNEVLEKYILGGHVGEFMEELKEEDPEKYQVQFAKFVRAGVDSDDLEDLYKKVHAAIRADPAPQKKARSKPADAGKRWKTPKQGYEARKAALKLKLAEVTA